jgi:hypothetical protein
MTTNNHMFSQMNGGRGFSHRCSLPQRVYYQAVRQRQQCRSRIRGHHQISHRNPQCRPDPRCCPLRALYLIAARRVTPIADAGILSIFPKEIVKMIAMAVYATRKDPAWIKAVERK